MEGKKRVNLDEEFSNEYFDTQFSLDEYFNDNLEVRGALLQEATYNYFHDNKSLEENVYINKYSYIYIL